MAQAATFFSTPLVSSPIRVFFDFTTPRDQSRLSQVSKHVRDMIRTLNVEIAKRIVLAGDVPANIDIENPLPREELARTITEKIDTFCHRPEYDLNHLPHRLQVDGLQAIWFRVQALHGQLSPNDADAHTRWQTHFHLILNRVNTLQSNRRQGDNSEILPGELQSVISGRVDRLENILFAFVSEESLACRFFEVSQIPGYDYRKPTQVSACFQVVFEKQTRALSSTANSREEARQLPTHLSLADRLLTREEVATNAFLDQAEEIHKLWDALLPDTGAGPAPETAIEKLRWLQNPAHAHALEREHLILNDMDDLPDAITYVKELSDLRINSTANSLFHLVDLPEAMIDLTSLRTLVLSKQTFTEIPSVLGRMHQLNLLEFEENQREIRIFPEEVARKQFGGFWGYLEYVFADAGKIPHYAGLPRENFTHVPFFYLFREYCSIPYFPMSALMEESFFLVEKQFKTFSFSLTWLLTTLAYLPSFSVLYVLSGICVWLNAPIFLVNLFLNLIVEPIISCVRVHLMGWDPLVRIRPDPAPQAG